MTGRFKLPMLQIALFISVSENLDVRIRFALP